ncbi:hypothetical protein JYU34_013542 [Plutella xylostella]|uniref:Uncharacterized protein n=1 Tax=Plutella xylostella TaxID=51655 RepID=A0ABQ7QA22_PLUXY|nr:hypothetical protein JYU34_013542 [Plutella xylostella]
MMKNFKVLVLLLECFCLAVDVSLVPGPVLQVLLASALQPWAAGAPYALSDVSLAAPAPRPAPAPAAATSLSSL